MDMTERDEMFRVELCGLLRCDGYKIGVPDDAPKVTKLFDIVTSKQGKVMGFVCKVCDEDVFDMYELGSTRMMGLNRWVNCGYVAPMVALKYGDAVRFIRYTELKAVKSVRLCDMRRWVY